MRVLLISSYEIGRQPFGLASPAAWLRGEGAEVTCVDLAVERFDERSVEAAGLIAFHVPMHTATRIAISHLDRVKKLNPQAHLCFFGLYAPVNEEYLRSLGVHTILGGEFEEGLTALAQRLAGSPDAVAERRGNDVVQTGPVISLARQQFRVPDRSGMPALKRYAKVDPGNGRLKVAGYTEASRGCRHLCRHCPIVPVYGGRFRVVQRDVVMEDIRRQVTQGAEHITFGDPDFFNGPGHAMALVTALNEEFPDVTYDVTIKVEHLRKHLRLLPDLRATGCLFVTSAVEAVDAPTLRIYEKNHTRDDFIDVASEFRSIGLAFNPTFVTFSPWTTLESYADLLSLLVELELVDNVAPIQFAIRLLIPAGSRLLELSEVRQITEPFNKEALYYPWTHHDPRVDALYETVRGHVEAGTAAGQSRREIFRLIWKCTYAGLHNTDPDDVSVPEPALDGLPERSVPAVTEPWYCCAEPTDLQLAGAGDRAII
ncbi:CUAEP/CCAEP-tail radical SAM (seleno)protein [Actinomadura sp. 9N215]|uniref:CUAEP/CCAEP-tail radical SAM (seleno)protein n=1 Tax=Actinomadura sp. 9N215 TaxID=3375150 RepID=UPI0037B41017